VYLFLYQKAVAGGRACLDLMSYIAGDQDYLALDCNIDSIYEYYKAISW